MDDASAASTSSPEQVIRGRVIPRSHQRRRTAASAGNHACPRAGIRPMRRARSRRAGRSRSGCNPPRSRRRTRSRRASGPERRAGAGAAAAARCDIGVERAAARHPGVKLNRAGDRGETSSASARPRDVGTARDDAGYRRTRSAAPRVRRAPRSGRARRHHDRHARIVAARSRFVCPARYVRGLVAGGNPLYALGARSRDDPPPRVRRSGIPPRDR